jgi:predicted metal-dependent peptidase
MSPLYGHIAAELRLIEAPPEWRNQVTTMCLSELGIVMYNTQFVDRLSDAQLRGVLAHEASHAAFDYFIRTKHLIPVLANIAHDYVINLPIRDTECCALPSGALLDDAYKNLSLEEVYERLLIEAKRNDKGFDADELADRLQLSTWAIGSDCPPDTAKKIDEYYLNGDSESKRDREALLNAFRERMSQALIKGYHEELVAGRGDWPAWLKNYVKDILTPRLNWKKFLVRFFGTWGAPDQRSYKSRNRRNLFYRGEIIRPGFRTSTPAFYLLVDTSGSMFCKNEEVLLSLCLGLVKQLGLSTRAKFYFVQCDADVYDIEDGSDVISRLAMGDLSLMGGGGSDFRPAFKEIWAHAARYNLRQAPILCFTDGMITVPETEPAIRTDTLWISLPNNQPPTNRWGQHVIIQQ